MKIHVAATTRHADDLSTTRHVFGLVSVWGHRIHTEWAFWFRRMRYDLVTEFTFHHGSLESIFAGKFLPILLFTP